VWVAGAERVRGSPGSSRGMGRIERAVKSVMSWPVCEADAASHSTTVEFIMANLMADVTSVFSGFGSRKVPPECAWSCIIHLASLFVGCVHSYSFQRMIERGRG